MPLRKLTTTDAFVVTDLDDVPSMGVVRSAPKILQGGAKDLARSMTYTFAAFGMQRGGASAGINAAPGDRADAVAAFAAELADDVAAGRLALDAAKGVDPDALSGWDDPRSPARTAAVGDDRLDVHLAGLGPAVAADAAVGLDGATVAIEGFGTHGPALAEAVEARGATVVAISTTAGSVTRSDGLPAAELRAEWVARGDDLVGDDPDPFWKVYQSGATVLFAGSKMGAVTHTTAEKLTLDALVAHQPIPYTTRALAILQRRGAHVVADFLSVAGPIFAAWPDGDDSADAIIATASAAIADAVRAAADHAEGPFLGACHRAEEFLATWHDGTLFGRPLA